jgi:hypothetical protein
MGTFTPLILFWYIYPVIVLFGCQFLVKLFSLNRRFKIKAPDLASPINIIYLYRNYLLFKKREVFIKKTSCRKDKKIVHLD